MSRELKAEAWRVNWTRIHRLWKQENTQVLRKQYRKRHLSLGGSQNSYVRDRAQRRNPVWSYDFIAKSSPWENGYVESFNGKFRDELLNGELFLGLEDARWVIDRWSLDYNHRRPHSALDYQTSAAFAAICVLEDSATLHTPEHRTTTDLKLTLTDNLAASITSTGRPLVLEFVVEEDWMVIRQNVLQIGGMRLAGVGGRDFSKSTSTWCKGMLGPLSGRLVKRDPR